MSRDPVPRVREVVGGNQHRVLKRSEPNTLILKKKLSNGSECLPPGKVLLDVSKMRPRHFALPLVIAKPNQAQLGQVLQAHPGREGAVEHARVVLEAAPLLNVHLALVEDAASGGRVEQRVEHRVPVPALLWLSPRSAGGQRLNRSPRPDVGAVHVHPDHTHRAALGLVQLPGQQPAGGREGGQGGQGRRRPGDREARHQLHLGLLGPSSSHLGEPHLDQLGQLVICVYVCVCV